MSLIGFRCPNTGREVTTGIDTDHAQLARMRKLKISVSCPDCPDGHGIPADEMYLVGETAPALHPSDPFGCTKGSCSSIDGFFSTGSAPATRGLDGTSTRISAR
jgi:hypothetical protein